VRPKPDRPVLPVPAAETNDTASPSIVNASVYSKNQRLRTASRSSLRASVSTLRGIEGT